jgi:hypothetical protein
MTERLMQKEDLKRKIVYSESLGSSRLIYRAFETSLELDGKTIVNYGVEVESRIADRQIETIENFSDKIDIVAEFMELIIRNAVLPISLYDTAIDFLSMDL